MIERKNPDKKILVVDDTITTETNSITYSNLNGSGNDIFEVEYLITTGINSNDTTIVIQPNGVDMVISSGMKVQYSTNSIVYTSTLGGIGSCSASNTATLTGTIKIVENGNNSKLHCLCVGSTYGTGRVDTLNITHVSASYPLSSLTIAATNSRTFRGRIRIYKLIN